MPSSVSARACPYAILSYRSRFDPVAASYAQPVPAPSTTTAPDCAPINAEMEKQLSSLATQKKVNALEKKTEALSKSLEQQSMALERQSNALEKGTDDSQV